MAIDHPALLAAEVRQRKAWEMKLAGASTADIIAADIGYTSRQGVHDGIDSYRRRVYAADAANLSKWVDLHVARLEALVSKLWPKVTTEVVETVGEGESAVTTTRTEVNTAVVETILRVLMREAKLLGIDAADQRADRQVEIDTAIAERFLTAFQVGLGAAGVTAELRAEVERVVLETLRAPVMVAADNRN